MKKITIAILSVALLFSLASCREPAGSMINTSSAETTHSPGTEPTQTEVETAYSTEALSAARLLAKYFDEHSNLDFSLLTPWLQAEDTPGFVEVGGFGCYILQNAEGSASYTFSGFPDALDSYVLTGFHTSSSRYNISGISCGMPAHEAEEALAGLGIAVVTDDMGRMSADLEGWRIVIMADGGSVSSVGISFKSTNLSGAIF